MQKSKTFSSLASLFRSSFKPQPDREIIKLLQQLLSTSAIKCSQRMKSNYINIHKSIVLDKQLLPSIQEDLVWISKQSPLWNLSDPLSVIEFVNRSLKYGLIGNLNNRWCEYMKNEVKYVQRTESLRLVLFEEEEREQNECPIKFLISQMHLFATIIWQIAEYMNSNFLKKIYDKAKNKDTLKKKIKSRGVLAVKQQISNTNPFKHIHYYFLKSLNYAHCSFLVDPQMNFQMPSSLFSFLKNNRQLQHHLEQSNIYECFLNSGSIINKINRISSLKENMQILFNWNKQLDQDLESIVKSKKGDAIQAKLQTILLREFHPTIWKSIIYILVMQAQDSEETINSILARVKDNRFFQEKIGFQILIPITLMLSEHKKLFS